MFIKVCEMGIVQKLFDIIICLLTAPRCVVCGSTCDNVYMRFAESNRLVLLNSLLVMSGLLGLSVVVFFFFATSPRDIGPTGVTFWFMALFVSLTSLQTLVRYAVRARKTESQHKLRVLRRSLRSSILVSGFITIALAMQSLRALSVGDLLLFFLILVIIEVYFRTK